MTTIPYLEVKMFSAKPKASTPLTSARFPKKPYAEIHKTGCPDLSKAIHVNDSFSIQEALKYPDDYYKTAPCAKERNWSKTERANRPEW